MNEKTSTLRDLLPIDRLLWTLAIVQREGKHLHYSWQTLFERQPPIDANWVEKLEDHPDDAVKLEAFVSRYGCMQDTMADKLVPRWLESLAERTGSQIENLNRAERLGVIDSAKGYTLMLIGTYNNLRNYTYERLDIEQSQLPPSL
ncbi:hypothetical protein ACPF7Z_15490 [Halomonas sp. GXIMD04776]|uniref:hypothetical protein n=1 Tax=Halomonas sp. GXIMD04776 TaxID=3415605 RepID=UPI003C9DB3AB